jgi:hypothetical protein
VRVNAPTAFSKRDRVDCEARAGPVSGSRSSNSLCSIVGQPGGVVAVGVAADQPEDPLPHPLQDVVLDLAALAAVPQAAGDGRGHAELLVDRLEQHRPAVGAGVLRVEPGDHALVEFEAQLRYTVCSHRASWGGVRRIVLSTSFSHTSGTRWLLSFILHA